MTDSDNHLVSTAKSAISDKEKLSCFPFAITNHRYFDHVDADRSNSYVFLLASRSERRAKSSTEPNAHESRGEDQLF